MSIVRLACILFACQCIRFNAHLDPLIVKEPQEVERSKVDALLAVECDFVAGRAAVDKINSLVFLVFFFGGV